MARLAARARWQNAAESLTAADAPKAVQRLLKTYDPKALRWVNRDDRHVIVREMLVRGDAVARRWLRRKLSRDEARELILEYGGAGSNEPDRQILRKRLGVSVSDLPLVDSVSAAAFNIAQRAAAKQRSRAEDERRLKEGEVSLEGLRAENSFFNLSLPVRIVDFGRPRRRARK